MDGRTYTLECATPADLRIACGLCHIGVDGAILKVSGASFMNTYVKFGAMVVVIIGVLAWLAMGGISESKTYYKTISELGQMGDQAHGKRLRVGGDVEAGSIVRNGAEVSFILHQDAQDV